MAYADKITTMRRMALISGKDTSGVIVWEGVEIEGDYILRHVGTQAVKEFSDDSSAEIDAFERMIEQEDLLVKFQDPAEQESWEPRADDAVTDLGLERPDPTTDGTVTPPEVAKLRAEQKEE